MQLIQLLLSHDADPNVQDKFGRSALMYACMERAGSSVASALISAGADPGLEDYSGASALVYAVNAHKQDTLTVLVDSCKAQGRDVIIIATDVSGDGRTVTREFLNAPPSPESSPVSCMSPSDIELRTNSPGSDGDNIFSFQKAGEMSPVTARRSRTRQRSEPWLAIQDLEDLHRTGGENIEEGLSRRECSQINRSKAPETWRSGRRSTLPDLLPLPALKLTGSGDAEQGLSRSWFLSPPDRLQNTRKPRELPPLLSSARDSHLSALRHRAMRTPSAQPQQTRSLEE
ncbi:hypothetical protein DNTS_023869 [Danionella cerebrum]|uniref:Uncharacterized protein n=1 Tax=Danionella cerebrum TaxID=2873325 RepID=A0A553PX17_9TELE|nr:hypothetical protein DNTS_023869 [Danionella translucida]